MIQWHEQEHSYPTKTHVQQATKYLQVSSLRSPHIVS